MTTVTLCDYPACQHKAVWKVELSNLRGYHWPREVLGQPPARTSMDVCDRHLADVTFDQDKIAEFNASAPSSEKEGPR